MAKVGYGYQNTVDQSRSVLGFGAIEIAYRA